MLDLDSLCGDYIVNIISPMQHAWSRHNNEEQKSLIATTIQLEAKWGDSGAKPAKIRTIHVTCRLYALEPPYRQTCAIYYH